MKDKQTPLMRQYSQIKKNYADAILFYRLGDFYETFNDDAKVTSEVCGIALTKRNNGANGKMPLAGFPYHQLDAYLPKLVRAGYRVAVCDQLEDPKQARGIVKRGVVEVVTPGVALYDKLLDSKRNNYVMALCIRKEKKGLELVGLSCADISTGEFFTSEFPLRRLPEVAETLAPSEILISKKQKQDLLPIISGFSFKPPVTKLEEWIFDDEFGREALLGHFKTQNLKGFGVENFSVGLAASGAVLNYINETQKSTLTQITNIYIFNPSDYMNLDYATRRNLEITYSMNPDNRIGIDNGSLISILDKTNTPMGSRLFKKRIMRPLRDLNLIKNRLGIVKALFDNDVKRTGLREVLSGIGDIERLITKVCTGRANPRDMIMLRSSLSMIPEIKKILLSVREESLTELARSFRSSDEVTGIIDKALINEPSVNLGTGNVFKHGFSEELDSYIEAKYSGKNWIAHYQAEERERSHIPSLKVGFNSVFGYYIEITKTHKDKVPEHYDRKQTLTNAERYITPELKEIETKILSAEERITEIEHSLFTELLTKVSEFASLIQETAFTVADADCHQSFAESAKEYDFCEPKIDESEVLIIKNGRHPVVERLLGIGESFTPNDTNLDTEEEQIHIITGPNMSGKSCYLRQVALVVLLGQIGSYVPAESAEFGLVDRIFTRVGAQDNITAGESTFLVEMQEAANIMNNATRKSLILLDEVGRGTATFDGISIAWSIAEYIHNSIGAKTLFATHYHELNDLADRYERIVNYKVEVVEAGSTVIFSHKVMSGASDHSFGIHVARMAGMPDEVIGRADIIMKSFEEYSNGTEKNYTEKKPDSEKESVSSKTANTGGIKTQKKSRVPEQLSIFELRDDPLRDQLIKIEVDNLTPIEALQVLSKMRKEAVKGSKRR